MKAIELLEKYPLTREMLREYFMDKLLSSIEEFNDVPEDFKIFLKQTGIDDDKIASFIDANPHGLVYFFDKQNIILQILHSYDKGFYYQLEGINSTVYFKKRKEAELNAISACFDIVEHMLTPKEDVNS